MLRFLSRGNVGSSTKTLIQRVRKLNAPVSRNLQGLAIGLPKETLDGEHRVALTPTYVTKLSKAGASVIVEPGAGDLSGFTDDMYKSAGAKIAAGPADVWKADVVTKVFFIHREFQTFDSTSCVMMIGSPSLFGRSKAIGK